MKVTPDVLLLPSRLMQMAREVSGSLVVNPGPLAKGNSGGTFAELHIKPIEEDSLRGMLIEGKHAVTHSVASRSFVQIVRI